MHVDILSLSPEYFESPFNVSILKRAKEKGLLTTSFINIRDFAEGRYKRVDDRPYGGGPGMLMMPGPSLKAIRSVKRPNSHTIYLSPQGKVLDAKRAFELSKMEHLILFCGHYEGADQRIIDAEVDEEISIGDYVLTNGCLPAIVLVDSVVRFIPGVLGNEESALNDTFQEGKFEGPQYTRPEVFEGRSVPDILLSGHHAQIEKWRLDEGLKRSKR